MNEEKSNYKTQFAAVSIWLCNLCGYYAVLYWFSFFSFHNSFSISLQLLQKRVQLVTLILLCSVYFLFKFYLVLIDEYERKVDFITQNIQ